jgi:hypothetical protein
MREGNSDYSIESHKDDSVTLTVGTVTAHIRGDSWREANDAASVLGQAVAAKDQIRRIYGRMGAVRQALRDLEDQLKRCDWAVDALLEHVTPPVATLHKGDERP